MKVVAATVCVIVFRGKKVLMLHRKNSFWQSVSGNVEKAETAIEAALREVREETGLRPKRLLPLDYVNAYYQNDRRARSSPRILWPPYSPE